MYSRSAEFTGDAKSEVEFATNVFVALQRAVTSGVLAGFTPGMNAAGYSACPGRYKKVVGGGRDGDTTYVEVANADLVDKLRRRNSGDCFFLNTDTEWRIAKRADYENDKCHPTTLLLMNLDPTCLLDKGKGKPHLPSEYTQDIRARSSQS